MNENRLRELMSDAVDGVDASETLRTRVSAAVGGRRRRRAVTRGWIAVGGAGLAAAAVLLVVPLVRPPSSAPPGPGVGVTAPASTGATAVDDIEEVLGNKKWYVVGIVARGAALSFSSPARAEDAMHIQLTKGTLQGSDGCNAFGFGPALLTSAPTVRVNFSSSAMMCSPIPSGHEEFLAALRSGPKSWSRDGNVVVLAAAGIEVTFSTDRAARPSSSPTALSSEQDVVELLGTKIWYVSSIITDGDTLTPPAPYSLDLAMRLGIKRNSVTGYDGCGWFYVNDSVVSSAPSVTAGVSYSGTQCLPPPTGQPEFADALLTGPKSWSMTDGDLVLTTPRYDIVFRTTPPALAGTTGTREEQFSPLSLLTARTWFVTGMTQDGRSVELGRPASPESAMRLGMKDGKLLGFDGCLPFDFEMSVVFASPAANDPWHQQAKGCASPPRGRSEFVDALNAGNKSWVGSGGELTLTTKHYQVTFSATPPVMSPTG